MKLEKALEGALSEGIISEAEKAILDKDGAPPTAPYAYDAIVAMSEILWSSKTSKEASSLLGVTGNVTFDPSTGARLGAKLSVMNVIGADRIVEKMQLSHPGLTKEDRVVLDNWNELGALGSGHSIAIVRISETPIVWPGEFRATHHLIASRITLGHRPGTYAWHFPSLERRC